MQSNKRSKLASTLFLTFMLFLVGCDVSVDPPDSAAGDPGIAAPISREPCPTSPPIDLVENFGSTSTTQENRETYLHFLVCQTDFEVELSPILAQRGASLRIVGQDKLEAIKSFSRNQLSELFFSGGPLPDYLTIYTTTTEALGSLSVTVLLRVDEPEKFNDFGLFADKSASEIRIYVDSKGWSQELSQIYIINGCNPNYKNGWDRLLPTEDLTGFFRKYSGFNNCKNRVIAANPSSIVIAKTYYSPYGYNRGTLNKWGGPWTASYSRQLGKYEDYVRSEIYGYRSSAYEKFLKVQTQRMGFEEITIGEFNSNMQQYMVETEAQLWQLIDKHEASFINVLEFLRDRNHKYEFRFN